MNTATEKPQPFIVVETEHENCEGCLAAAESAKVHAQVTGSTGATWIEDGSRLDPPRYHRAVVKRDRQEGN